MRRFFIFEQIPFTFFEEHYLRVQMYKIMYYVLLTKNV